jgi:hypothetical protein
MKTMDRRELNEGLVDHLERLGRVRASMMEVRPGTTPTSDYSFNKLTEAMERLAQGITLDPVTPDEIPT